MKQIEPAPPHIEGPTWQRYTDGTWVLPSKTLGWGIINWMAEYVRSPDGSGPMFLTLEQARWLLNWFAVDHNGEFLYRSGVLARCKGWGKDPLAAVLSLAELCGPVVFSHWDANGDPVGKQRFASWTQIISTSWDNTKNCMMLMPALITPKLKTKEKLEICKTVIYSGAGGRIESCTSSPYALEGNRGTLVIQNETQWWQESNGGHDLSNVIDGNVAKVRGARKLSICNAHVPGEDSVAERDYDAWQTIKAGRAINTGIMYDRLEAPADTPVSEIPSKDVDPEGHEQGLKLLREGIEIARGDSVWLPVDAVMDAVLDIRNPVSESRRKHLNQVLAAEDSWIAPTEWDACAVVDETSALQDGDKIALGFDGSKSNDWSALCACRIDDGMVVLIKAWNPSDQPNGEIPREDVDATVRACFAKYDVVSFRSDVKEFESYVDVWGRDFKRQLKVNASPGHPVQFDMRGNAKRFTLDCERFLDAVIERELKHNGNTTLRQHVLNAKRFPVTWGGVSIRKASKDSNRKIDAAVTAVLCWGGRNDYLMSKKARTGRALVIK